MSSNPTHAEIATAAYMLYLKRDRRPGNELDDWLAAEAALRSQADLDDAGADPTPDAAEFPGLPNGDHPYPSHPRNEVSHVAVRDVRGAIRHTEARRQAPRASRGTAKTR
ncbi:MAG TPA: DUF2934 domain-containing protein [Candidatus Limnocylindria bacterium]|nr:DUF2934 domain-containing protein [Candidatus Limnocylindria bacterium]